MRTCLALWHDHIISRLSQNPNPSILVFGQALCTNNIVALFDASRQSNILSELMQEIYPSSPVPLFDYEHEARLALSHATSLSLPIHPLLPFNEHQLRILDKLRIRHLSILASDHVHWKSIHILYSRFLEFIESNHIERTIFSEYPHTIYDYLFSLACINSGVRCYAVQFVGQLGRGYSYIIDMNSHSILPSHGDNNASADEFSDFLDSNKAALTNYSSEIQALYSYSRGLSKREALQLALSGNSGFTLWTQKQANALRIYNSFVDNVANIPAKPYGIFFLQVEPESTVTPLSSFFSDQAVAVSDFYYMCIQRGLVPCLKEHPHQYKDLYPFSSNYHWQSHPTITAAKSSEFYVRLKQELPYLRFLAIRLEPAQIFRDDNFVLTGTLNGTVGVQSLFCGKEVVEYGLSWYQCHPLVNSRRYDVKSGTIITEPSSGNTVVKTLALETESNIRLFISSIVELVDRLSRPIRLPSTTILDAR